jgi:hypothetical protein
MKSSPGGKLLLIVVIGADIADMGKGEGDELAGIGRVGQDFLIPGHGGVETHLAKSRAGGAKSKAFKHRSVGKDQSVRFSGAVSRRLGAVRVRRLSWAAHRCGRASYNVQMSSALHMGGASALAIAARALTSARSFRPNAVVHGAFAGLLRLLDRSV